MIKNYRIKDEFRKVANILLENANLFTLSEKDKFDFISGNPIRKQFFDNLQLQHWYEEVTPVETLKFGSETVEIISKDKIRISSGIVNTNELINALKPYFDTAVVRVRSECYRVAEPLLIIPSAFTIGCTTGTHRELSVILQAAKNFEGSGKYYYTVRNDSCLDVCPKYTDIRVGSYACTACKYMEEYSASSSSGNWVICPHLKV